MSISSLGSKNMPSKKPALRQTASGSTCYLLHAVILLGFFFDPEEGGDMFLKNVGSLSADYTSLHL
jgi:hypothetical protein